MRPTTEHADCLPWLAGRPANAFHAVCTDPPYGLVEYQPHELKKLRAGRGGVWRIPPKLNGVERNPLPRFTVLSDAQKAEIGEFFATWGRLVHPALVPGGHALVASNPTLQQFVVHGMTQAGFEHRATLVRVYHGFRGGDRPKNAEKEFPGVCVTPRGNYEPWLLFRKPLDGKTVAQNLRKWGTGGLRMLAGGRPLPDVFASGRTPQAEQRIAPHPSLKPQRLLRCFVRALLPLGEGLLLDPFMGSGSTVAAAAAVGYDAVGVEIDKTYFRQAAAAIPQLARLYPDDRGEELPVPSAARANGPAVAPGATRTPSLFDPV